jgi:hypothetical protein
MHAHVHWCACIRVYLFPFRSVKTQSSVCFTNVYERICSLFVHLYEHARHLSARTRVHSWLPNSLFLFDTGDLNWTATSFRTCHPAFLPGSRRFSECACFSWLFTEYCAWVKVLNVCEFVYVWVYVTGVWPSIKCLLHMHSTSSLYIQASGHTDVHVLTDKQTVHGLAKYVHAYLYPFLSVKTQSDVCFTNVYERICFLLSTFMSMHHSCQYTSARTHAEITSTPLSCCGDWVWRWFALAPQTIIHTKIHSVCMCMCIYILFFVCFSECTRQLSV